MPNPTTYEEHSVLCPTCSTELGTCPPESGCVNRYAHYGEEVCGGCKEGEEE